MKNMEKPWFGDPLQHWKLEYRTGGVVKITVPVYLQKDLQNGAKVVHLRYPEDTLGAQMCSNVVLEASVWESKILCFFYYPLGIEIDLKSLSKWSGYFYLLMCFWAPATKMVPRGLPGPQKHPPRTTSERIPTQHPETSAEAHTELAHAEFPILGGAAMTRRRRLQYSDPSNTKTSERIQNQPQSVWARCEDPNQLMISNMSKQWFSKDYPEKSRPNSI